MSVWLFTHLFISTNIRLLNSEASQEQSNKTERSYQDQSPAQQQGEQQSPAPEVPLLQELSAPLPSPAWGGKWAMAPPATDKRGRDSLGSSAGTRSAVRAVSPAGGRTLQLTQVLLFNLSRNGRELQENTVQTNDEFLARRRLEKTSFLYMPLHQNISLCTFGSLSGIAIKVL